MYGAEPGQSETASGHAADTTPITTPASASRRIRTERRGGPASRYVAASAGTTIQPWSILVMKARPTKTPAHTRCFVRPDSTARSVAQPEATSSSTSSGSGMSTRASASVTGESPSIAAARTPATGPNARRTVANSSPTVARVQSACGSNRLKEEKPNARADKPMSQIESGGLSTVMKLPGSSEPKNHAFRLTLADLTADA